jgi:NADPH2:quinone reductase
MRAAVLNAYGETPEVATFDEPRAGAGEVVVEVSAAGLNPIDLRVASGALAARRPPLPSVPGMEGTGRTADGRRVYFGATVDPWGALAERTVAPESEVVEITSDVDDAAAVAYGVAGLAAWLGLERRAQVAEGETVIVLGASGVVGMIAVQAAKLLGAGRVVAVARNQSALARAQERGADAAVVLGDGGDGPSGARGGGATYVADPQDRDALVDALREACDGEAQVVFDPLWGEPAAAALAVLGYRGRLVQLGQSAGADATLASADIRFKEIAILGHTNFAAPADVRAEALQRMWAHDAAGELHVDVETVPLAEAAGAWERQAAGPGHKLVVVP